MLIASQKALYHVDCFVFFYISNISSIPCYHHYRLKSIFPLCGVGQFISLMALLHAVLSVGSMWVMLDALLSSLIVSSHVLRGLPRGFLPGTGKFNILWSQWVSSLLATCPYHLSLLFLITCPILTRPIDWRWSSFFFLSHSDALHIHLTILSQHYFNLHISNINYSIKHYKSQFNVYFNSPVKYTIAGKYMKI